jgi:beta-lactamase regulating signal transducer with metallopeptidase domain/biotin carboxyl carrier protein
MSHFIYPIWGPWSSGMLRACWQGAIAVAAGWAICRLARLPAALKCWIWRAVYLKLILALIWVGPVRLPVWRADSSAQVDASVAPIETESMGAAIAVSAKSTPAPRLGFGQNAPRFDWRAVLLGLWLAGVLACAAHVCRRWAGARSDRRGCEKLNDDGVLGSYRRVARLCQVARPPPLMVCVRGGSPRLVGLLHPMIVLPASLLETTRRPELDLLLAHELAHYKRRDLWWAWLALLGRMLFWFHPAVWLAERQWRLSEEIACDHAALSALGASTGAYARMLLNVATQFGRPVHSPVAIGVVESATTLKRRLIAMRKIPSWSRSGRMSVGLVLAAAAVIAIVPWRLVAQQAERDGNRAQPETAIAAAGPSSRPAIHPPLHTRDEFQREAADHNTVHGTWVYDNVVMGLVECPSADVSTSAAGVVREVRSAEGQHVNKGEPLFVLDNTRARAVCAEAEAEYKKADINYQRLTRLKKDNAVSSSDVDLATADRQIAAERLEIAQKDLNETQIVSPMTGVVSRLSTVPGRVVNRGALLAQVMDVEHPSVRFDADSAQYPYLQVGQKVRVLYGHTSDHSVPATISFLPPTVDASSGTLRVGATIEDPDHRLRPGMAVKVDLQLYREEDLRH